VVAELSSPDARRRYTALGWLRYINDKVFVAHARGLLYDQAQAQMIGNSFAPRYRRVCDQALDTLVYLLALKLSFGTNVETIYTDGQISEAARMVR
jgi:hypothetical protein